MTTAPLNDAVFYNTQPLFTKTDYDTIVLGDGQNTRTGCYIQF